MDEVDGAGEGEGTFDEVLQEFGGQLSSAEFSDWLDSLITDRHAAAAETMLRMMFDANHHGETIGQLRLRVKNRIIREWKTEEKLAEENRNRRRMGKGRELGLPGYRHG